MKVSMIAQPSRRLKHGSEHGSLVNTGNRSTRGADGLLASERDER